MTPIGMVLGTEDATPLQFWFGVSEATKVQLDDIVMIEVPDPTGEGEAVRFYGVVDEVRRRYEGVQFDGDTEMVVQGLMPANIAYAAHVLVTRVDPEDFIPPGPGDAVYFAEGNSLDKALYLDSMDAPLPAGVLRNGEAGYINLDFIDGTKGAHINISGISGIATKTSYALFLLYSVFHARHRETERPLLEMGVSAKALIFNVKGEDLLFLDKPNQNYQQEETKWTERRRLGRSRYEICGLEPKAFENVALRAPAMEGEALMADVRSREGVTPYVWSLHAFAAERMLPFVLADKDAMSNLGFLVSHLEERLAKLAADQKGPDLEIEAGDEDFSLDEEGLPLKAPLMEGDGLSFEGLERTTGHLRLKTFDDLVTYLEYKLLLKGSFDESQDSKGGDMRWTAQQAKATREAFIRRLRGAAKHVRRLIRGDLAVRSVSRGQLDILNASEQIHVIDLHTLPPIAQMFVVGVLLRQVFQSKEEGRKGKIFIVLDELNKYAPAEGDSPIKDVLLDIAERGRSMGILLIGAQQTASEVERRVVSNAAVRISGRLDAAEAERPEYRFMPGSFRSRATILAPGTMIVHQPDVPSPMMLTFPFPAWATRRREVDETVSDEEALDILG